VARQRCHMDARVRHVIDAMRCSICDQHSVRSLSQSVNVSPSRLRQLFVKETGWSPTQYLKKLRLERAEQLLHTTFFSVKEITFLSGARDLSHFVRDFKKYYGLTPSEFRARIEASQQDSLGAETGLE
jgi:transcriptional regulator GlxA family with amidase domain